MITIIDTIRAVSELVAELFSEPPTTKDIHEGFARPCTHVQAVGARAEAAGELLRHDVYQLQVIRLAKRSQTGYLELLEYQEKLREALEKPIYVTEEFALFPENVEFDLNNDDMALVASFTVENLQDRPEAGDEPLMDTLEQNISVNKESEV